MPSTDLHEYLLRRFPLMGTSTVYISGDAPYHLVHHDRPGIIASVTLRPEQAEAFREAVAAYGKAQRAEGATTILTLLRSDLVKLADQYLAESKDASQDVMNNRAAKAQATYEAIAMITTLIGDGK